MAVTVAEVMREVRNGFVALRYDGAFTLTDGVPRPGAEELTEGDLAVIRGCPENDGVHPVKNGALEGTRDGSWLGTMWILRPPADFRRLCARISDWDDACPGGRAASERFGEYSVTYGRAERDWQSHFSAALRPWRRMFTEVPL